MGCPCEWMNMCKFYYSDTGIKSNRSLILQATPFADEACETIIVRLEEQSCWKQDLEKFFRTVCSHLASFNMLPVCLGGLHGHPKSNGNTKQVTQDYHKSHQWVKWPGWNWTNWTGGYSPAGTLQLGVQHVLRVPNFISWSGHGWTIFFSWLTQLGAI